MTLAEQVGLVLVVVFALVGILLGTLAWRARSESTRCMGSACSQQSH